MGGKPLYSVSPSSFLSLIAVSYHKETTVVILWGVFYINFCKLFDKNYDIVTLLCTHWRIGIYLVGDSMYKVVHLDFKKSIKSPALGLCFYLFRESKTFSFSCSGLFDRDHYVLKFMVMRGIPCATVIGGGYSRDLKALSRRHTIVHRAASKVALL